VKRLIYLAGEPGSGKSTLMRRLTTGLVRVEALTQPRRDLLFVPDEVTPFAVELGRQRGEFSGTDALGMTVIEHAVPWLSENDVPLVLGEGARLANRRFLGAAVEAGYEVTLGVLDHPHAASWREARADRLGKAQNSSWVAGRRSAALNLARDAPQGVRVIREHPDHLFLRLRPLLF
jgi:hypothetical protein